MPKHQIISAIEIKKTIEEERAKRKKGVDLALLKKWGDKGYGLPEPKVKAVQREEVEPLAEISAALVRRSSRLAMDE